VAAAGSAWLPASRSGAAAGDSRHAAPPVLRDVCDARAFPKYPTVGCAPGGAYCRDSLISDVPRFECGCHRPDRRSDGRGWFVGVSQDHGTEIYLAAPSGISWPSTRHQMDLEVATFSLPHGEWRKLPRRRSSENDSQVRRSPSPLSGRPLSGRPPSGRLGSRCGRFISFLVAENSCCERFFDTGARSLRRRFRSAETTRVQDRDNARALPCAGAGQARGVPPWRAKGCVAVRRCG
jgi:hypothetical protein